MKLSLLQKILAVLSAVSQIATVSAANRCPDALERVEGQTFAAFRWAQAHFR